MIPHKQMTAEAALAKALPRVMDAIASVEEALRVTEIAPTMNFVQCLFSLNHALAGLPPVCDFETSTAMPEQVRRALADVRCYLETSASERRAPKQRVSISQPDSPPTEFVDYMAADLQRLKMLLVTARDALNEFLHDPRNGSGRR
jgi:hypothetical protein